MCREGPALSRYARSCVSLAEGEAQGCSAGIEELDLEVPVHDVAALSNELVEARSVHEMIHVDGANSWGRLAGRRGSGEDLSGWALRLGCNEALVRCPEAPQVKWHCVDAAVGIRLTEVVHPVGRKHKP